MAITTRETTATGVTNKGSPLTNAEVDTNFIELQQNKVELDDLSVGAEGDPSGDGAVAYDNTTGVFTYTPPADISGAVTFAAQAGEALTKGDAVYVSGVSGNKPVVSKADADDSSKMAAFGLAEADASLNAAVNVVTFGTLYNLDTSGFTAGDTVYVDTTAGGLTATKPSGESSLIQNIGKVIRSHASAGSIKVGGAGRTNDVPNLADGNVFIGNSSNQAEKRALVEADISDLGTYLSSGDTAASLTITSADINGGTIDGATIGGTTAAAGTFTTFTSNGIDDNASSTSITIASGGDVTIDGDVAAGASATGGVTAYAINYSNDHILNVFGSLRSSGNTILTYGAKPSTTTNNGYVSAAGNFAFEKTALEISEGGLSVKFSPSGTDAVGDALTMSTMLDVSGSTAAGCVVSIKAGSSGNEGGQLNIDTVSSGTYSIDAYQDDMRFLNGTTSGHYNFYTNSNAAVGVTIHGTGRIGIGTTGPSFPLDLRAPSGGGDAVLRVHNQHTGSGDDAILRLSIAGTTADSIIQFGDSGDADIGRIAYHHNGNTMRFFTGAAEEMRLENDGDLHVDGNVVAYSTTVSDERLKDDVQDITGALDTIDALRGVTYTWNAGSREGQRDYGVIAQDVEQVIPEIVHDTTMPLLGDEETVYKTVDYEKLCAVLINAVSELRAEVEALKNAASR